MGKPVASSRPSSGSRALFVFGYIDAFLSAHFLPIVLIFGAANSAHLGIEAVGSAAWKRKIVGTSADREH
jgi:hypothetical protein